MNISKLHTLLDEKIEELGVQNVSDYLKYLKKFEVGIDVSKYALPEKIIFGALLGCPCMFNKHIFHLLNVNVVNKSRLAQKYFEDCNKERMLLARQERMSGPPSGPVVIWYLLTKGYNYALSLCFPQVTLPAKGLFPKFWELDHDEIIANIYCEICAGEEMEETGNRITKINWFPRHLHYRRLETNRLLEKKAKDNGALIPDAIIHPLDSKFKFFLEVDRSTKDLETEKIKLKKYAQYFQQTREGEKLACLIVYSVDSERRGEAIKNIYENLEEREDLPDFVYYLHQNTGKELRNIFNEIIS